MAFTDTKSKGITKARASAIEWLARTGVTEGFGCSGSNAACEYKPNNSVTRGAMAQYFQRLAGWTDAQVAAVYANKSNSFTDISGLTAERRLAIMWLADTGITKGCDPDGSQYCPSKVVNRGAMAEFMQKFAGVKPVETKTSVFPDVSAQSVKVQYDDSKTASQVPAQPLNRIAAINWLSSNKITQGFGTNSAGKTVFRPSAPVTRGAMAEFMQRLASKMTPKTSG
ncbi:MAG: S-layer homology domain-containing protein [Bifidobacteriaceae bacterium]|nr:S-layer homology domain-containing protein [Bifidobacteriaceae bacterium]